MKVAGSPRSATSPDSSTPRVRREGRGLAQIYDSSTVAALDAIVLEHHQKGKHVEIIGIDEHSARWHALSGTSSNH